MPGFYQPGEYDIAGFIVGAAERNRLLTGDGIEAGDLLLGLPSTGLHTNGYSLARRIFFADLQIDSLIPELGLTVADELLKVHRSYLKPLLALQDAGLVKGAAHITGGGMTDNIPRILPPGLGVEIDTKSWPVLPVFESLRQRGNIPEDDWRRTFNLGIGMVLVVPSKKLAAAQALLKKDKPYLIGTVVSSKKPVRYL